MKNRIDAGGKHGVSKVTGKYMSNGCTLNDQPLVLAAHDTFQKGCV